MGDPVLALGLFAFCLLLFALPLSFWALGGDSLSPAVTLTIAVSNFALTAQLIFRWWQSSHFPISNLYESLCFLAWACTLVQLFAQRSWPSPLVSAISTPLALLSIAFASFALPESLHEASPLVPALRSSWLVMHVSVIMCSYAALLIGSVFSIAVLFTDRGKSINIRSSSLGTGRFRSEGVMIEEEGDSQSIQDLIPLRLNDSEQLDNLSYRTISFGFLLLTIGLISGAVWANEA